MWANVAVQTGTPTPVTFTGFTLTQDHKMTLSSDSIVFAGPDLTDLLQIVSVSSGINPTTGAGVLDLVSVSNHTVDPVVVDVDRVYLGPDKLFGVYSDGVDRVVFRQEKTGFSQSSTLLTQTLPNLGDAGSLRIQPFSKSLTAITSGSQSAAAFVASSGAPLVTSSSASLPAIQNAVTVRTSDGDPLLVSIANSTLDFTATVAANGSTIGAPSTFTPVAGPIQLSRVTKVSCGSYFTMMIIDTGALYGMGDNSFGQLCINSTDSDSHSSPEATLLTSEVVDVACGYYHALCILANGGVRAWGRQASGALGNGESSGNSPSPVTPSFGFTPTATTISAGDQYSQVLMSNGVLYGFGENGSGQLGIEGSTTDQLTPVVSASSLSGSIADVACGYKHTLCILANGGVQAWGTQIAGALGDNNPSGNSPSPVTPSFGFTPTATTISAGSHYSQVLMSNGVLYGFGNNSSGQLGIEGNTTNQLTPVVSASSLSGSIADVACGTSHTLCILANGEVRGWGTQSFGALGDGNTSGVTTTPVTPLFGFTPTTTMISGGYIFSQVLMSNGTRYAFGSNLNDRFYFVGQLGIGTTASSQTTPLAGVTVNATEASLSKIYPSPQFNQGYWYQEYSGDTTFLQKYQTL